MILYYSTIVKGLHRMKQMFFIKIFRSGGAYDKGYAVLGAGLALFYSRVADWAGLPLEQVLCDSLYKLAGELSLEALQNQEENPL